MKANTLVFGGKLLTGNQSIMSTSIRFTDRKPSDDQLKIHLSNIYGPIDDLVYITDMSESGQFLSTRWIEE